MKTSDKNMLKELFNNEKFKNLKLERIQKIVQA